MNRKDKLKKIYEVIWYNEYLKDMTYKCSDDMREFKNIFIWDVLDWVENNPKIIETWTRDSKQVDLESCNEIIKKLTTMNINIWRYYKANWIYMNEFNILWKDKRTPIDEQSDEVIDFIYWLIEDD